MLYLMKNGKIISREGLALAEAVRNDAGHYIGIFSLSGNAPSPEPEAGNPVPAALFQETFRHGSSRFESHEGLDLLCVNYWDAASEAHEIRLYVFLQKNLLQIYCSKAMALKIQKRIAEIDTPDLSFGQFLYTFFEWITAKDLKHLETLESSITALENEIIINKSKKNFTQEIIVLRKKLMIIKGYYEQLLDIFSDIDANENGLFDRRALKLFKILSGKTERLLNKVNNLRDYVTQIREAYQAEVDISLNMTMKVLTVITSVFMPLTLIAGWYGMNFEMPEYHAAFGYPMIILVSLAVVAACIFYFKKHKWF